MNYNAATLADAIEGRRVALGDIAGTELSMAEVGRQIGVHASVFSRLKSGRMPGADTLKRLGIWLGEEFDVTEGCDCDCDRCGMPQMELDVPSEIAPIEGVAAIMGFGRLSDTNDETISACINRVKELLAEGAVGVSISTDLDPADLPSDLSDDSIEAAIEEAGIRPRHVAIVDTPAFSGAHLDLGADGFTVEGPIAFEGVPTGDLRILPYQSLTWDDALLPIPIIFDIADGDHTGATIGFIDRIERVEGVAASIAAPLTASIEPYPAVAFAEPEPGPMRLEQAPGGFTRYSGTIMPAGVCHKGKARCFTYTGKEDLNTFHTGGRVTLDNGETVRVGPLAIHGLHADGNKLNYGEALARTDDARRVASMGRIFHSRHGLLFSGVLTDDAVDLIQLQATAPSVELWPNARGKYDLRASLNVIHPAMPVAASIGDHGFAAEPAESDPVIERLDRIESALAALYSAHLSTTLD